MTKSRFKITAILASLAVVASTFVAAAPAHAALIQVSGLQEMARYIGNYSTATDGLSNSSGSGNFKVEKPAGATTVKAAFVAIASKGSNAGTSGFATVETANVVFTHEAYSVAAIAPFHNMFGDVTSLVSTTLNAAAGGSTTNIAATYDSTNFTGMQLTVVWNNPAEINGTTLVQFGHAETVGETTTITFPAVTQVAPVATLSLGIGWTIQGQPYANSNEGYSFIKIASSSNPTLRVLTDYAGGCDDSNGCTNGQYLTVGGYNDSTDNPSGAWTNNRSDDELYNVSPFLAVGDTSLTINTLNPRGDDTIFMLVLNLPYVYAQNKVVFDGNGSTSGTMANQEGMDPANLTSNSFVRDGYTFNGWNTKADGTGTAYANGANYSFAGDLTLYAQWTENTTPAKPPVSIVIGGFRDGKAALPAAVKAQVRAFMKKYPDYKKLTVTGYTEGPSVLSTDGKLSRSRAVQTFKYISQVLKYSHEVHKVRSSQSKAVGAKFRSVKIELSN